MPNAVLKAAMMTNSVGSGMWKWLRGNPATACANPPLQKLGDLAGEKLGEDEDQARLAKPGFFEKLAVY